MSRCIGQFKCPFFALEIVKERRMMINSTIDIAARVFFATLGTLTISFSTTNFTRVFGIPSKEGRKIDTKAKMIS